MTREEYRRRMRRLVRLQGFVMFGLLVPGVLGALVLTSRLADSSTWYRPAVFWAMLPTILAPILIALAIVEKLDKRSGIRCSCGQSLSFGPSVLPLLRQGGSCLRCGKVVVS